MVAEYGLEALSRPAVIANMLKDLLPESLGIARIVIAAAEDRVADALRERVAQGLDKVTAARLTASAFADATMLTLEACAWVVGAIAAALGLADRPATVVARALSGRRRRRPRYAPQGRAPSPGAAGKTVGQPASPGHGITGPNRPHPHWAVFDLGQGYHRATELAP
jgi:hypothetical protein